MLTVTARRYIAGLALLVFASVSQAASPLKLEAYNPGAAAVFPVSSVLVSGEKDAILVDAQFSRTEAEELVRKVQRSGKNLTTIYISHGDPDFYFGLDTLTKAYPKANVVATAQTVAHIKETQQGKLAYWGPKLGAGAPDHIVVPEILQGDTLKLEGRDLKIMGLDGPQPDRSFVWIPSLKAVLGGVVLSNNIHVWMADTQSPESHQHWLSTLSTLESLKPKTVIPGHWVPGKLKSTDAPAFTARYIKAFDAESAKAANASDLVKAMTARFPDLADTSSLELSAKVAKGEMKW